MVTKTEVNEVFIMIMNGCDYKSVKKQVEKQTNMSVELADDEVCNIIHQTLVDSGCAVQIPAYKTDNQKKISERNLIALYLIEYEEELWKRIEVAEIIGLSSINITKLKNTIISTYEKEGIDLEESLVNLPFLRDAIGESNWSDEKLIKSFGIEKDTLEIFRRWYQTAQQKFDNDKKLLYTLFSKESSDLYLKVDELLTKYGNEEEVYKYFQTNDDKFSNTHISQVIKTVKALNLLTNVF